MTVRRLIAVVALALTASACSVQSLGAPGGDYTLTATFDDVGTLVIGHGVQIADVRIGSVTDIGLEGYKAKVTMSIEDGKRIPQGTNAQISQTSLLGERYVRLILPPGSDMKSGPFLASGAKIQKTSVQPDIEAVTEKAGPLVNAIAGQDLTALVDAARTAFGDKGEQLNRMIAQTADVTKGYKNSTGELNDVIDGLAKVGNSLSDGSEQLDRLPGNLNEASEGLLKEGKRLKSGVGQLTALAQTFNDNVHERHAKRLKVLVDQLGPVVDSALRGRQEVKAVTQDLLKFIVAPPITRNEQVLLYVWLKGLLPPKGVGGGKAIPTPTLPSLPTPGKSNPDDLFKLLLRPPV